MTPFTIKWGILATGGIAECFTKDLLADPATRGATDVIHEIVAVASSTSAERAAEFIKRIDGPASAKTYGSYQELVADSNVDIIYVATPHSHHFQNAMLAIQAGRNVLCEKALTVTASQTRKLIEAAREKNVFFMEAVWTRFFPLSIKVRELIKSGAIGPVYRVLADTSFNHDHPSGKIDFPDSNRMVNPELAGGVLLDLGVYSLNWVFQTLYHTKSEEEKEAPKIISAVNKYETGADETTSIIVQFPKNKSMGIATSSLRLGTDLDGLYTGGPAIRIQGSSGEIQVTGPAFRPTEYKVIKKDGKGHIETVQVPIPKDPKRGNWGHGMFWEADECARCLRDSKKQSDTMPWSESILIMEAMDTALREGGVKYPDVITSDEFEPNGTLNGGRK